MVPAAQIERLLDEVCRKWGFCLPAEKRMEISGISDLGPYEFAAQVLRAEGFNPEYENLWVTRLAELFSERTSRS